MAHISIICPHCQSRYQVEPDLCGRAMRCPNPVCRAVFEVKEEEPAPLPSRPAVKPQDMPKPPSSHVSGSVGDMVPILTGEAVDPSPAPSPASPSSGQVQDQVPLVSGEEVSKPEKIPRSSPAWDKMPPVRRDLTPADRPIPAPPDADAPDSPKGTPEVDEDDFLDRVPEQWSVASGQRPEVSGDEGTVTEEQGNEQAVRDLAAATWEAPPIRGRVVNGQESAVKSQGSGVRTQQSDSQLATGDGQLTTHQSPLTRRRVRGIVVLLLLILSGGVAWGIWFARGSRTGSEAGLFQKAEALYKEGNFAEAVVLLQALNRDFPDSKKRNQYRFLAELSDVRDPVYNPQGGADESVNSLDRVVQFLKVYHKDPLLTPCEGDVWQTLYKLSKELTAQADLKKDRRLLERARYALDQAGAMKPPMGSNAPEKTRLVREAITQAAARIAEQERRQAVVERVRKLKPSAPTIQQARALVLEAHLKDDPELQKLLAKMVEDQLAGVTFTANTEGSPKPAAIDSEPTILVAPLVGKAKTEATVQDQRPVFALARGMLYALDPRRGDVLWARRVGADTTLLPLRLPASAFAPEIALVLSSDSQTVSAVETASGRSLWKHQLEEPCLGQPVLAGRRLLVPTFSGRVDEIDIGAGRLLGYYHLGQPLTVGGVLDERTGLAYFPADNFAVYILDVARRKCAGILYAGHPSGSLRSAPVILGEPGPHSKGLLILPQAAGLDAITLRTFELPIRDPDQEALSPEPKIRGWTWFPPYHDGERLALATDAGMFSLFGLKQKGNRDPLLYPLLKDEAVLAGSGAGRAQIVHADGENFWVLAHGKLQRLQLTFSPKSGPGILERWADPPRLGSPLHAAQARKDKDGNVFFLVTRTAGGQTCLASAVEGKSGTILWQRQLGLECRGQPVLVSDQPLVKDAAGVFLFNLGKAKETGQRWQQGGALILTAPIQGESLLLPSRGGSAAILNLAGLTLKIASISPDQDVPVASRSHDLPAKLAGTPAMGKAGIVLPLGNGILLWVPAGDGPAVPGPNWRGAGVEEEARGHVLALSDNDFLVSDGGSGLHLLHWPEPKVWDKKKTVQLPRRIVAPPVLVSGKEKTWVCVADAADTLNLIDAATLAPVRSWAMPGPVSAGPFVQGTGIGCVVGKNRLVWIDPEKDAPLWEYTFVSEIVGQPQLVDGVLLVANLAGQYLALDPANGRPRGSGYTLKANVAPAATPVPFGSERLFAPLTDGTIMLLDRKHFRQGETKGNSP